MMIDAISISMFFIIVYAFGFLANMLSLASDCVNCGTSSSLNEMIKRSQLEAWVYLFLYPMFWIIDMIDWIYCVWVELNYTPDLILCNAKLGNIVCTREAGHKYFHRHDVKNHNLHCLLHPFTPLCLAIWDVNSGEVLYHYKYKRWR